MTFVRGFRRVGEGLQLVEHERFHPFEGFEIVEPPLLRLVEGFNLLKHCSTALSKVLNLYRCSVT